MQSLEKNQVIFQHDNDPKHIANYVVDLFIAEKFHLIWHPP